MSHVCISPRVANTQVRKNIAKRVFENGNTRRHLVMTKAQTSLEAVTAESIDDQNGNLSLCLELHNFYFI